MSAEWKTGKPEVCGVYWAKSKKYKVHYLVEVTTKDSYFYQINNRPLDATSLAALLFGPMLEVPDDGV
jgi:hypothetical protein